MSSDRFWKMLDTDHPDYVEKLVDLINWSMNCDFPTPRNLYDDITGFSMDEYGENICHKIPANGFMEISYLGEALVEYANRPSDVHRWYRELLEEEMK